MTWGLVGRLTALLAAVLTAPLAGDFGVRVSATASATPAAYTRDTAAFTYDTPQPCCRLRTLRQAVRAVRRRGSKRHPGGTLTPCAIVAPRV